MVTRVLLCVHRPQTRAWCSRPRQRFAACCKSLRTSHTPARIYQHCKLCAGNLPLSAPSSQCTLLDCPERHLSIKLTQRIQKDKGLNDPERERDREKKSFIALPYGMIPCLTTFLSCSLSPLPLFCMAGSFFTEVIVKD